MNRQAVDCLIVTGAGASRNLGSGDSQLPLMGDWSATLCNQLDHEEAGLAQACGLNPEFDGPEFEIAIGEVLEWDRVRRLEKKFEPLALQGFSGAPLGKVREARQNTTDRLVKFKAAMNHTLYTQFGQEAVDDDKAERAYGSLLSQLGEQNFAIATTNYDRSAESALFSLDHHVVNGFVGKPPRRRVFEPSNLAENRGRGTTLLYLHGAVGWYERDGNVILDHPDERFDPNRGSPVVLYPDPDKKPAEAAIVSELWQELEFLANEARSVLVLGHSLHDEPLRETLATLGSNQRLAVSYYSKEDKERVERLLPLALSFHLDFSVDAKLGPKVLKHLGAG